MYGKFGAIQLFTEQYLVEMAIFIQTNKNGKMIARN